MSNIGPFSFASMDGRVQPPTISASMSDGGFAFGDLTQTAFTVRTIQPVTTYAGGWTLARAYRASIGAVGTMSDGGGATLPLVLVCDCQTRVRHGVVEAEWTLVGFPSAPAVATMAASNARSMSAAVQSAPDRIVLSVQTLGGSTLSTTWRSATGDAQPPIRRSQIREVARVARAWGIRNAPVPERTGGSMEFAVEASDENAAVRLAGVARQQIGAGVLELAGARLLCDIGAVSVDWYDAKTSPTGSRVVRMSCRIGLDFDGGSDEDELGGIVQYGRVWGQWVTDKTSVCTQVILGCGSAIGSATIHRELAEASGGAVTTTQPVDRTGQWVRILDRVSRLPVWHGVILSRHIEAAGDGPVGETYACAEPLEALRQVTLTRWYQVGMFADVDPGELLPFNGDGGGMSVADRSVGFSGSGAHAVAFDGAGTSRWTLRQIVDRVLAAVREQMPGGPQWTLGGQFTALEADPGALDRRGMNALDIVLSCISPQAGVVLVPAIAADGSAVLAAYTLTQIAITAGGWTLPAHTSQIILDLTDPRVASWAFDGDGQDAYDEICVEGRNHEIVATLLLSKDRSKNASQAQLCPDWTTAEETAWDDADADLRARLYSHVWRRFRLQDSMGASVVNHWHGQYYSGGAAIADADRCSRTLREIAPASDPLHGDMGETGELLASINDALVPSTQSIRFTRHLPLWESAGGALGAAIDWTSVSSGSAVSTPGALVMPGPLVFSVQGAQPNPDDRTWQDLTEQFQIEILPDSPRIVLGREDDAEGIKAILDAGDLAFTLGIQNPIPWRMSWRRPPGEQPRDQRRSVTIKTDRTFFAIEDGTVIRLDGAAPQKRAGRLLVGWDQDQDVQGFGRRMLALARTWHGTTGTSLRARITAGDTAPGFMQWSTPTDSEFTCPTLGQMITIAQARAGRRRRFNLTVNAVVTSVTVNLVTGDRDITADRVQIGADSATMLLGGGGNMPNADAGQLEAPGFKGYGV